MEIKSLVLHQIIREEDQVPELNLSNDLIPIEETVAEFVQKLVKSYTSKNPTLGTFEADEDNYPFQSKVKNYLADYDFLKFSHDAMNILKKEMQVPNATGGYVIFVHYNLRDIDNIITVMLDNSIQFAIKANSLDIEKLKTLDIDRLARANKIDLNKWSNNEELYLSFIKGTREVSQYFQKFIGTTDITSAKKNISLIDNAMKFYFRDSSIIGDEKYKIYDDVNIYFEQQLLKDEDIFLDSISSIINPADPTKFKNYLDENEIIVSGRFRTTKRADFKSFKKRIIKEPGYSLNFEKQLVKTGKIQRVGNSIIINEVPTSILNLEFDETT